MNEQDILELFKKGKSIKNTKFSRRPVILELSNEGCRQFRTIMKDSVTDREDYYKISKDTVHLIEKSE